MQDTGARPYPRPKKRRRSRGAAAGTAEKSSGDGQQDEDTKEEEEAEEESEEGDREDEGEGEEEEEGPVGLEPYPLRAAAILEDAYQFLAWYLDESSGGGDGDRSGDGAKGKRGRARTGGSSPTVLLTVQVISPRGFARRGRLLPWLAFGLPSPLNTRLSSFASILVLFCATTEKMDENDEHPNASRGPF